MEPGTEFSAGDVFCSVETDKAVVDFESQDDGVLAKILAPAGSADLPVGTPIMVIVEDAADVAAFADFEAPDSGTPVEAPAATEATPPPPPPAAEAATPEAPAPAAAIPQPSGGRVVASPLAHMLAKEMGHDISAIPGTGPDGRIIAADVKEFTPSAVTAAPTTMDAVVGPPIAGVGYTDYPLTDQARQVAAQLAHAKQNVPHYYLTVDVQCDALLKLRDTLQLSVESELGMYELFLKAAGLSMKTVPVANAAWMDSVVRVYDDVDVNVVMGSGDELCTPILRDVARKGIRAISDELQATVGSLEEGEPVSGGVGTFTVMNLGMYGIKSCAPIIREPQACALALGAMETRVVPSDDEENPYAEKLYLTATLSCDHRVVDGAVGAEWLSAFKTLVENPESLLL